MGCLSHAAKPCSKCNANPKSTQFPKL
jgi:hypothetical protein